MGVTVSVHHDFVLCLQDPSETKPREQEIAKPESQNPGENRDNQVERFQADDDEAVDEGIDDMIAQISSEDSGYEPSSNEPSRSIPPSNDSARPNTPTETDPPPQQSPISNDNKNDLPKDELEDDSDKIQEVNDANRSEVIDNFSDMDPDRNPEYSDEESGGPGAPMRRAAASQRLNDEDQEQPQQIYVPTTGGGAPWQQDMETGYWFPEGYTEDQKQAMIELQQMRLDLAYTGEFVSSDYQIVSPVGHLHLWFDSETQLQNQMSDMV